MSDKNEYSDLMAGIVALARLAQILGDYRIELAKNNITGELADMLVIELQRKLTSGFGAASAGGDE